VKRLISPNGRVWNTGNRNSKKGKIKTKNLASARKMLVLPDESERTKAETSSLQS